MLADELHFGKAAERLNLAQPGLSQQLQRLEKQVGSPLFTRNSRIVELTDAGRAMLEPARAALRATDQAERAAREAARLSEHPLRVGVSYFIEDVVPTLAAYASERSDVQLWISRIYEAQGHDMLAAASLDAFIGLYGPNGSSGASRIRAVDVPLLALAGPNHPIARQPSVALSVYRRSPIAFFSRRHATSHFDYLVNLFSEGAGREALSIREFYPTGTGGSHREILTEVAAGNVVGFGTPATLAGPASHLRVLPFDPPLAMPTYISWQPERSLIVDEFVEQLSGLT